jgi:hypothetical protein
LEKQRILERPRDHLTNGGKKWWVKKGMFGCKVAGMVRRGKRMSDSLVTFFVHVNVCVSPSLSDTHAFYIREALNKPMKQKQKEYVK